jgi:hypothetical protein
VAAVTFTSWLAVELAALAGAVMLTASNLDRRGEVVSARWGRVVVRGWAIVALGMVVVLAATWSGWN